MEAGAKVRDRLKERKIACLERTADADVVEGTHVYLYAARGLEDTSVHRFQRTLLLTKYGEMTKNHALRFIQSTVANSSCAKRIGICAESINESRINEPWHVSQWLQETN
jgi:hypothetical protein